MALQRASVDSTRPKAIVEWSLYLVVVPHPFLKNRTVSLTKVTAEATFSASSFLPPSLFSTHLSEEMQDA